LAATDSATGSVIGVLLVEIVGARAIRESFLQHYALVSQDADIRLLQPEATGLVKSIAVSASSRGRGVATALIAQGMRELAAHGANHCYSLAWTSKQQGCALCGILTALGFRRVRQIERFWYHDSIANGYLCPSCGHPCVCSAQVMIR
jgi:ribosomal protein S18 acetylase RimI-like enzyme